MNSKNHNRYILWLASWYPNRYQPFNGDFVQRHAKAASLYSKLIVCHFPQLGAFQRIDKTEAIITQSENLTEIVFYIKFKPTGITLVDKAWFNLLYYIKACALLRKLFKDNGLPSLVHVHVAMKCGNLARWIKRRYKIGYLITEHSTEYQKQDPNNVFTRSRFHLNQLKKIFKDAELTTAVSTDLCRVLSKEFDLKRTDVVRNTVDVQLFNKHDEKEERFTFIHVSSFADQKNVAGILKTFANYATVRTDWCLKLVGPTPDEVVQLIKSLHLQNFVTLLGEVPYTEVAAAMKKAHAFVLFSWFENFPCVIVEALCCGLPVIAADTGGVKEAINNENGILVEPGNEDQLLKAIANMHGNYQQYNNEEISIAASRAYGYKKIGADFFNLYSTILPKKG